MPSVGIGGNRKRGGDQHFSNACRRFNRKYVTVGAPAVSARAVFDGGGGRQLHSGEQAGTWSQLHTPPVQLAGQGHLHGFVGERRAVTGEAGSLVEIQDLLSATGGVGE